MNDLISRQRVLDINFKRIILTTAKPAEMIEQEVKALPPVTPTQKWIPVSERLPEEFTDVICCTDAKEVFIASYLGKLDDGSDCFDDNDGMMWEGDVIAWMPLPKPYVPDINVGKIEESEE